MRREGMSDLFFLRDVWQERFLALGRDREVEYRGTEISPVPAP